ncbi:phospholipase A2 [Corynebacterium mastitidis]|uniref:phospholipase A2 n=1 Tax=Corynebacterium mastitidis TaxID=161890 RepID=UPI003CC80374
MLHDYCSYIPEHIITADISGACARHDLCYEQVNAGNGTHMNCNNKFLNDLYTVCQGVYKTFDPRLTACMHTANLYYGAVSIKNH